MSYLIHAIFKEEPFLVIIEGDPLDPAVYQLRIAKMITLDSRRELGYWAAPTLARLMEQAADYYAQKMEKAKEDIERSERPTAPPGAESSGKP
jgi:hypothetical protein